MPLALIKGPLSSVWAWRGTTLPQKTLHTELMSRGAKASADSAFFGAHAPFFFNPRLRSHLSLMQGTHLNVTRRIMWPAKEKQNDVSYKRALSGRSERLNNDFFFPFPEPSHRLSLHSGDNVPHVLPCLFALSSLPLSVEDIQLFLPLCASVCLGSCLCLSTHRWEKNLFVVLAGSGQQ